MWGLWGLIVATSNSRTPLLCLIRPPVIFAKLLILPGPEPTGKVSFALRAEETCSLSSPSCKALVPVKMAVFSGGCPGILPALAGGRV